MTGVAVLQVIETVAVAFTAAFRTEVVGNARLVVETLHCVATVAEIEKLACVVRCVPAFNVAHVVDTEPV